MSCMSMHDAHTHTHTAVCLAAPRDPVLGGALKRQLAATVGQCVLQPPRVPAPPGDLISGGCQSHSVPVRPD